MRVRIEPLDPAKHDRASFTCGNPEIDRFLLSTAAQAARHFKSATFVLVGADEPATLLGFYTLSPFSYRDAEIDSAIARSLHVRNLHHIPMILLGQLGVAMATKGKGLGTMLLRDAALRALSVAAETGGGALVTDPIDDAAATFYRRFGFAALSDDSLRLFIAMKTLAASLKGRA